MPEDERTRLEVQVARVEEKIDAMKARQDRVEAVMVGVVLILITGIVTVVSRAL